MTEGKPVAHPRLATDADTQSALCLQTAGKITLF